MNEFLGGAVAMGSLVIALFFLRYWKETSDRFFLYFALSFVIESLDRVLLTFIYSLQEDAPVPYLMRLIAYGLILYPSGRKTAAASRSASRCHRRPREPLNNLKFL